MKSYVSAWSHDSAVADGYKTKGGGSVVQGGVLKETERFVVEWHQDEEATACARHAREAAQDTRNRIGKRVGGRS